MKIFPYVMVRLGGLPFDWMQELSWHDQSAWKRYLHIVEERIQLKGFLIQMLEESPKKLHCGYMLKSLFHLKVDLMKGRTIRVPEQLAANLLEEERPFYNQLMAIIFDYQAGKQQLEEAKDQFDKSYFKEISTARKRLQEFSGAEVLKKGLLLASQVLLKQIEKYTGKPVDGFRKKELQTELSLLKYLSRICTKTSPFSTFTALTVFSLHPEHLIDQGAYSTIRLNNYLFSLWRDVLNHYPPFYKNMPLGLNPCLKIEGDSLKYLLNSRNVESVQTMESNELLEFIIDLLKRDNKTRVFNTVLQKLQKNVEADEASLEGYLLQLISFGFLEWRWPFSGLDPDWDEKLFQLLEKGNHDEALLQFSKGLQSIHSSKKRYALADGIERKEMLSDMYALSKELSESLLSHSRVADNRQEIDFNSLQHYTADKFVFSIERLIYEDTSKSFSPDWQTEDFHPIISELDELLGYLGSLYWNKKKDQLKQFFLHYFTESDTVDLFTFYEAFYQSREQGEASAGDLLTEQHLSWQKSILEYCHVEDGVLLIDLAFIKGLSNNAGQSNLNLETPSYGSLIHLFKDDGRLKGFTDTSFAGFGKMMGRFLHHFPNDVTLAIQNWNDQMRNGKVWVENKDASLYNPNLHPPLIPMEIRMPGSQNTLSIKHQISMDELAISYDAKNDDVKLIRKRDGQQVYIFDLGFEAPESRSPMYQLLLNFSYETVSQRVLASLINHHFLNQDPAEITELPRIEIGQHLIIQRKTWLIPKGKLIEKPLAERESDYFFRLNQWRVELGLPSKVFTRMEPVAGTRDKNRRDDYKPQYIDFESPLFVRLFYKSIKKVETRLIVEEVLPLPSEVIGNQRYVSEYLVHWERAEDRSRKSEVH